MTIGLTNQRRRLDPKQCFELYIRVNSSYKVPTILKNEFGIYNHSNGKPFSNQAVWSNIGTYMVENMTEAKKGMAESWKRDGVILTDEKWYKLVLKKAKYLGKNRYKEFLAENSYLTPYLDGK